MKDFGSVACFPFLHHAGFPLATPNPSCLHRRLSAPTRALFVPLSPSSSRRRRRSTRRRPSLLLPSPFYFTVPLFSLHWGINLLEKRFSRNALTEEEKKAFKKLLKEDGYYTIRVSSNVLDPPGRDFVVSSVRVIGECIYDAFASNDVNWMICRVWFNLKLL
ncbi:uncharacterized protein LOC121996974 [Zingiber officinale]|uniref:uncharacterized protein LOC121996974 n=1 Tax=Zingiber officinale TaxID=94328 RepID=UPI001C4C11EE|nr:uncharacterized protein LOC121996974 [Zingiber officinale]